MARPKGIPFTEENAGANYAEFAVSRKPDGKIRMQRFLFILTYLAFALVYCFIFLVLVKMGPLIAILPLFLLNHVVFYVEADKSGIYVYCNAGIFPRLLL